jgi:predicted ArsR family transcriptional regulator
MARSLARAIPPTAPRLREVEEAGAEMGAELAEQVGASESDDPFQALSHALEALGFEPRRAGGEPVRYELMTCPYAEAVRENPAVVCTLHKGIIRGVLDSVAPAVRLTRFEPHDPDEAGCLVEVTRVAAKQPPRKAKPKSPD